MNHIKITTHYIGLQIFYWITVCVIYGFVSFYLTDRGYTPMQIGIVVASSNILSLCLQSYLSSLTDRSNSIRIKHIMFVSLGMASLAVIVLFFISSPTIFLIIYIFLIIINTLQIPLLNGLSSEHIIYGTPLNFGFARGVGSVSYATSALLFGALVQKYGSDITLPIFLCTNFILMLLVLTFPSPPKEKLNLHNDLTHSAGMKIFYKQNKNFFKIAFALFLVFFSPTFISTYIFQIVEYNHGNASSLGKALAISGYVEIVSMGFYVYIAKILKGHKNVLLFSSFAFFIKALVTFFAHSISMLYVAQAMQMLSFALFIPAQVYFATSSIAPQHQVKGQMIMNASCTLAAILASLVGGFLISRIGLHFSLMFACGVNLIGFILLYVFSRKTDE